MSISGGMHSTPAFGRAATMATTHLDLKLSFAGVRATMDPETKRELDCQLMLAPALVVENVTRAAGPPRAKVNPLMWTCRS